MRCNRRLGRFCALAVVVFATSCDAKAQQLALPPTGDSSLADRVDSQAAELAALRAELQKLQTALESREPADKSVKPTTNPVPPVFVEGCGEDGGSKKADTKKVPVVVNQKVTNDCGEDTSPKDFTLNFVVDYDKGFLIKPVDAKKSPFQLKTNAWIQFRHVGFVRDEDTWTDNSGTTRPIRNRNAFDIERARLVFSGFAHDPRLTYFLHLDGDTDGRHAVDFFDYWWAWKFSDALRVQFGKRKAPGSRQWLLGARDTRLSDRPIATDFFRPDRSLGIFATGEPSEGFFYEFMLGNGYRTANLNSAEINNKFAFAGTTRWEPNGKFGKSLTDHECSNSPLIRFGHSFSWAAQQGQDTSGSPLRESGFVRLTDGTNLTQAGALTPGTTVSEFDVYLYAVDAAFKYQGWSVNSEVYFRWIQDLQGNGPLARTKIAQRGFFVEGGRVIVRDKVDWNVRYSQVSGPFGDTSEYGAGVNWYPLDTKKLKLTFDVTQVDGSPLNNTATEFLAGDSGTLFRTQFQAEF